jgi:hypothetical protein
LLKDYLKGLCRAWDNLSAQFLDAYFQFLSDVVEAQRDVLAGALAPYAGLYDYKDWFFSAPKPLPRAHLHAPVEAGAARLAGPGSGPAAADYARVDFAFWLGDRLVAAQSSASFLTPKKAREHEERLRLAGVEVVQFGAADLAGDKVRELFTRILGGSLAFWEGEALPSGPFSPTFFDE